ncbi:hypothetical protein PB2503_00285 [Parvularcula bermudensis HTCC2503]|uniref:Transmembrane anchor protein n=1 Tax=Parvularcula bermudensis (strain ATCC BAA-594 / HTCC2503 / KCTC 12087) TaxID=314260 RepID=E0TI13_PARBH|nr:hypothetical protein [Parvularcula bermudensis]ADM10824.1 hypothetical protein PB2503_00285 [Parvularcula bermudensis HTCC2503]
MYNANMPKKDELPSTAQLLRSTVIALMIAAVILVVAVLPGEYGIDPTRIGRALGLTQMGEIKQQLAEEAAADEALAEPVVVEPVVTEPDVTASEPAAAPSPDTTPAPEEPAAPVPAAPIWKDEQSATLAPDAATEIKLVMEEGAAAEYEWTVDTGHLNYDLHADYPQGGGFHSYKKGRAVTEDAGSFTAEFDGAHGWFWRNRSGETVTVTLKVRGDYKEVH